jgi:hypothetical protein
MTSVATLDERVANLERSIAVIVATKGTLRLCTSHLILVWSILLTLAGVGTMVLQTSWAQQQQGDAIIAIAAKVDTHIAAPGHAISLERLAQMQSTLNEVKAMMERYLERK